MSLCVGPYLKPTFKKENIFFLLKCLVPLFISQKTKQNKTPKPTPTQRVPWGWIVVLCFCDIWTSLQDLIFGHLFSSILSSSAISSTSSGWTVSLWLYPVLSMLAQEPSRMPGRCLHTICFSKIGICFSHNYVRFLPSTEQSLLLYSCLLPRLEFMFIVYLERCLPGCQLPLIFFHNLS